MVLMITGAGVDWLQPPVIQYLFIKILYDNPLKYNQNNIMTTKAGS